MFGFSLQLRIVKGFGKHCPEMLTDSQLHFLAPCSSCKFRVPKAGDRTSWKAHEIHHRILSRPLQRTGRAVEGQASALMYVTVDPMYDSPSSHRDLDACKRRYNRMGKFSQSSKDFSKLVEWDLAGQIADSHDAISGHACFMTGLAITKKTQGIIHSLLHEVLQPFCIRSCRRLSGSIRTCFCTGGHDQFRMAAHACQSGLDAGYMQGDSAAV